MPLETDSDVVADVAERVQSACYADDNVYGPDSWDHHVVRVVENARWLAGELGADLETVTLAALLHDYAAVRDPEFVDEHHEHGARLAGEVLRDRVPEEQLATVQDCVRAHRASAGPDPETPAEHCVASGDGMAHLQAVPSLLRVSYASREQSVEAGARWVSEKLERSWGKLHPVARDAVRDRYEAAQLVLDLESGVESLPDASER